MVASHTTKKQNNNPLFKNKGQYDQAVGMALGYIKHWTHNELARLNKTGEIIITAGPKKNEFKIGLYKLQGRAEHCWTVWNANGQWVQDFWDRRSAVFYCMLEQRQQYNKARNIRTSDHNVAKMMEDRNSYLYSQKKAVKSKNFMLYDILDARLSDVNTRLEQAQDQLEKNLTWAKYTKPQDGSNETTRTRN
jgi:hypothetical protein